MNLVEKLNNYLVESESFANDFLPLKETLQPIQKDFQQALTELKNKSDNASDIADKVFYINRYTDLVKKMESVFDTRSKRLQQTLTMLAKIDLPNTENEVSNQSDSLEDDEKQLTPEQANEILKILSNKK